MVSPRHLGKQRAVCKVFCGSHSNSLWKASQLQTDCCVRRTSASWIYLQTKKIIQKNNKIFSEISSTKIWFYGSIFRLWKIAGCLNMRSLFLPQKWQIEWIPCKFTHETIPRLITWLHDSRFESNIGDSTLRLMNRLHDSWFGFTTHESTSRVMIRFQDLMIRVHDSWVDSATHNSTPRLIGRLRDSQVAPNWVKVATDGNIFGDKTFFEVSLKNFLLTSWPCWRYLKGRPWLVFYASKKIVTIRYTDRIIWKEKGSILGNEKMMQKLG